MSHPSGDSFNEAFRKALSDLSGTPSDSVLNRIQETKAKKIRIQRRFFIGISGIIVTSIIILATIFMPANDDSKNSPVSENVDLQSEVETLPNTNSTEFIPEDVRKIKEEILGQLSGSKETYSENSIDSKVVNKEVSKAQSKKNNIRDFRAYAGEDIRICGLSARLGARLNAENSNGKWKTNDSCISFSSHQYSDPKNDPIASVHVCKPGVYTLTWTESAGNTERSDEVVVNFFKSSGITLQKEVVPATCGKANGEIEIAASGNGNQLTIQWLTGNFPLNTTRIENLLPGSYQVRISDNNNCEEIFSIEVPDKGNIEADFLIEESDNYNEIRFINKSSGTDSEDVENATYTWNFGDTETSNEENPHHFFRDKGIYKVTLTVETDKGCSCKKSIEDLNISEYELEIPTTFTPDGDGLNDIFKVYGKDILSMEAFVFNRKGELLHSWNNVDDGWDGRIKGSELAMSGTYFILVKVVDVNGITHTEKSFISLFSNK